MKPAVDYYVCVYNITPIGVIRVWSKINFDVVTLMIFNATTSHDRVIFEKFTAQTA